MEIPKVRQNTLSVSVRRPGPYRRYRYRRGSVYRATVLGVHLHRVGCGFRDHLRGRYVPISKNRSIRSLPVRRCQCGAPSKQAISGLFFRSVRQHNNRYLRRCGCWARLGVAVLARFSSFGGQTCVCYIVGTLNWISGGRINCSPFCSALRQRTASPSFSDSSLRFCAIHVV